MHGARCTSVIAMHDVCINEYKMHNAWAHTMHEWRKSPCVAQLMKIYLCNLRLASSFTSCSIVFMSSLSGSSKRIIHLTRHMVMSYSTTNINIIFWEKSILYSNLDKIESKHSKESLKD